MKLHVNMPGHPKGTSLEVMGLGEVKNGDVLELTDVQVAALETIGLKVPSSGDMYVYQESKATPKEPKTTNLPGVEEVAEKERAKSATPKKEN